MSKEIEELTKILKESNNIVFFGGAGCSCESGIPDFRSSNGLFNQKLNVTFTPEQLVSHTFFKKYTEEFFNFYRKKLIYEDAKPNIAHITLAKLEEIGKLKGVITQNIDGLHQMAGSKKVLELHGSIHRNYCTKCGKFYDLDYILKSKTQIPYCTECGSIVKPDVVLYEESLDSSILRESIKLINEADVLIVGGTSLVVYPAAGLIDYYKGNKLILINKTSTPYDYKANLVINDKIGKVLKQCMNL
ncbi:NAD-dependent protein deacylase [Clostridiaceae bacterium 14S0207]|nr:NAD-dependent protein deacylase [Clostridiaceae bacterium 14S0207]